MTATAGLFRDLKITLPDSDRFVETVGREVIRMPKSVRSLVGVLGDESVWCMAVVAGSHIAVTSLKPSAVLLFHYVAIRTRRGIVTEVAVSFRVPEGIDRDSGCKANPDGCNGKF